MLAAIGDSHGDGKWKRMLMINDTIADITLQQVLTRPKEFDVIATMNLNGDYLSDALAAQVGGIGIAPGGNINYQTGCVRESRTRTRTRGHAHTHTHTRTHTATPSSRLPTAPRPSTPTWTR